MVKLCACNISRRLKHGQIICNLLSVITCNLVVLLLREYTWPNGFTEQWFCILFTMNKVGVCSIFKRLYCNFFCETNVLFTNHSKRISVWIDNLKHQTYYKLYSNPLLYILLFFLKNMHTSLPFLGSRTNC